MALFSFKLFTEYLVSRAFFDAAALTLLISVIALIIGMAVGLALAVLQESRWRVLRLCVLAYLWMFRGTPVLLQLVFAFNVLPAFGIVLSGFTCAVLALGLNEGAYMAEIMRAGIRAVGAGQRTAARALGLEDPQIMRWVVLPQALRIIVPPIGNQFIAMLKLSALVSVIGVQELLLIADKTASSNFRYIETLSVAGIYYLVLTSLFMIGQSLLERRLKRRGRTRRAALSTAAAEAR